MAHFLKMKLKAATGGYMDGILTIEIRFHDPELDLEVTKVWKFAIIFHVRAAVSIQPASPFFKRTAL